MSAPNKTNPVQLSMSSMWLKEKLTQQCYDQQLQCVFSDHELPKKLQAVIVMASAEVKGIIPGDKYQKKDAYAELSLETRNDFLAKLTPIFVEIVCQNLLAGNTDGERLCLSVVYKVLLCTLQCVCAVVLVAAVAFGLYNVMGLLRHEVSPAPEPKFEVVATNTTSEQFAILMQRTQRFTLNTSDKDRLSNVRGDTVCTSLYEPTAQTDAANALVPSGIVSLLLRVCSWERLLDTKLSGRNQATNHTELPYVAQRSSECVQAALFNVVLPKCSASNRITAEFAYAQENLLQKAVQQEGEVWQCHTQYDAAFEQWLTLLFTTNERVHLPAAAFEQHAQIELLSRWQEMPCSKHRGMEPWNNARKALLKTFSGKVEARYICKLDADTLNKQNAKVTALEAELTKQESELNFATACSSAKTIGLAVATALVTLLAKNHPYVALASTGVSLLGVLGYELPTLCRTMLAEGRWLRNFCDLMN